MSQGNLSKKSALIVLGMMIATANADNLQSYADPFCTSWN